MDLNWRPVLVSSSCPLLGQARYLSEYTCQRACLALDDILKIMKMTRRTWTEDHPCWMQEKKFRCSHKNRKKGQKEHWASLCLWLNSPKMRKHTFLIAVPIIILYICVVSGLGGIDAWLPFIPRISCFFPHPITLNVIPFLSSSQHFWGVFWTIAPEWSFWLFFLPLAVISTKGLQKVAFWEFMSFYFPVPYMDEIKSHNMIFWGFIFPPVLFNYICT